MSARQLDRYGAVSIALHWASAALIASIFAFGWRMTAMPISPAKMELYALHKSLGLTMLLLTAARAVNRLLRPAPTPVPGPKWQQRIAAAVHFMLYALLFALPLSGWAYNSLVGFPLSYFGFADVPALVAANPALKEAGRLVHVGLGWSLLVLLAIHIGAALHHHVVLRDGTLARILPYFERLTRRTA